MCVCRHLVAKRSNHNVTTRTPEVPPALVCDGDSLG